MGTEEILFIVIAFIIGVIITYLLLASRIRTAENRWRSEFERWKLVYTDEIRKDSVSRSRSTLKGKIAERMAPILPEFAYNPADARFIGLPVDFVIFDGYTQVKDDSEGTVAVILLEVKKGKGALSTRQRLIKRAVKGGRVRWETLVLGDVVNGS
jgi:predicted Holliday junction resolvase-like endonuclease